MPCKMAGIFRVRWGIDCVISRMKKRNSVTSVSSRHSSSTTGSPVTRSRNSNDNKDRTKNTQSRCKQEKTQNQIKGKCMRWRQDIQFSPWTFTCKFEVERVCLIIFIDLRTHSRGIQAMKERTFLSKTKIGISGIAKHFFSPCFSSFFPFLLFPFFLFFSSLKKRNKFDITRPNHKMVCRCLFKYPDVFIERHAKTAAWAKAD